jgi:HK97 gp10 family phage protein
MIFRYVGDAALIAKAQGAIEQAVTQSAEDLVGEAQGRTPVDTGTLKASIHVTGIEASGSGVIAKVATGGEANQYAVYVHEGTYKMTGRPFLTQALLDNATVYREAIIRAAQGAF